MTNNYEKVQAALDRIEDGLANINSNEDWLDYLRFQSQFYNYSFRNTFLIFIQKPSASYVKGFKSWNELGRYVKKGSKGIQILAPCTRKVEVTDNADEAKANNDDEKKTKTVISGFKVTYVYDIADTDGSDENLPVLVKGLSGNSEQEKELYDRLLALISKEHTVEEVSGTYSKGSYNIETKVISIRTDLEYLQKIKTLIHEYAHLIDFQMNPDEDISRNRRELIAESVAFVVASRIGLDTSRYSISYIQSWLKDKDEIKQIADTVQKISYQIINNLAESKDSAFFNLKED